FSELAEDVRARRADEPGSTDERAREDRGAADEVRRAFREVRGVLRAVVEGVDDVIVDLFGDGEDAPWARVATSQETKCSGCGATIAAGADAWARRRGHRSQFRCVACGADPG